MIKVLEIIKQLTDIHNVEKRFPKLSEKQQTNIAFMCNLILNGLTWEEIVCRANMTWLELGELLMYFNDNESKILDNKELQNQSGFKEREKDRRRIDKAFREGGVQKRLPYPDYFTQDNITIGIQINGKTRDSIGIPYNAIQEEVEKIAFQQSKVKNHTKSKKVVKIIYVKNRVLNILTE